MGRSSLIMILGFTTALLKIGSSISKVSNAAMEDYTHYDNTAMAHIIAGAGMNMASRAIFENPLWRSGFSNKRFANGAFSVTVEDLGGNMIKMISTGVFSGTSRIVACVLQPSSFSRYNYHSVSDQNGYWVGGDTIWGPFHCNNYLNVANVGGSPVFMQRTTSLNGIYDHNNARPIFKGGYDKVVNVTLPSNLAPLQTAAQTGGMSFNGTGGDVFIQFTPTERTRSRRVAWFGRGFLFRCQHSQILPF